MKKPISRTFAAFCNYNPFHNIIHYYVDLSTFLITSGDDTVSPKVWWALNRRKRVTSLYSLEVQYGGPQIRDRFVAQGFKRARSGKKTFCGDRLGFRDFFVPVLAKGRLLGYLQAGAFGEKEVSQESLGKCWRELTGREVSPDLPEFREFARVLLEIPVLDGPLFPAFQEALELFAELLTGESDEERIGRRLHQLQREIFSKRLPHSYWLDWALGRPTSESVPAWGRSVEQWGWTKDEIGLTRVPTTVLAVLPRRTGRSTLDWVSEILRVHKFQRQSFLFAHSLPETVGGRLDDYGAVFVTSADPKLPRLAQRRWIQDIARKVRDFAEKELGGPVLVGVGETMAPGEPLNPSFRQAVLALHPGGETEKDIVFFEGGIKASASGGFTELRRILDELNEAFVTASFSELEILKQRLLKQAIQLSFQNTHEIRWHFQYALDRLAETVGSRIDLSKREAGLLREGASRSLEEAATLQELVLAFQEALTRLEKRMEKPLAAQRDRSLEKTREYLDRRFKEPMPIARLAKMAGVSASTFSRRFKQGTGMGLEVYLQKLRLDEARRLLKTGNLPVARIAKSCGFKSASYFIRLFRLKNQISPQKYRQKSKAV